MTEIVDPLAMGTEPEPPVPGIQVVQEQPPDPVPDPEPPVPDAPPADEPPAEDPPAEPEPPPAEPPAEDPPAAVTPVETAAPGTTHGGIPPVTTHPGAAQVSYL